MTNIKQYEPLWGSWHVDSLIGEGSFGKVYKVSREEFGQTYYSAVKIISIPQNDADLRQMRGEGMDEASARSYFHAFVADIIQEITLMSEFRGNSNIVSFEDHKVIEKTGEIGWDILIRMELLRSLSDYIIEKPLSEKDVVKLGMDICRALELCAIKSTIHRDIKPDNIFISQYGDYKLGDFGIARQIERTMSGLSKKGTYTYMAPEVFRGYEYGASVDTYSLGIVMYRFLNQGRTPFLPDFPDVITPRDRDESLRRRMNGEALPPIKGIEPKLNEIVMKACAFDRKARFVSPTEMRKVLEFLANRDIYAPVTGGVVAELTHVRAAAAPGYATPGINPSPVMPDTIPVGARPEIVSANGCPVNTDWIFNEPVSVEEKTGEQTSATVGIFEKKPNTPVYKSSNKQMERTAAIFTDSSKILNPTTPVPAQIIIGNKTIDTAKTTALHMEWSQIRDISQLAFIKGLTTLDLPHNNIADISPLAGMKNLATLYIEYNQIGDITPLSKLINLKTLFIQHNRIADLTPLSSLTRLKFLIVSCNNVRDISPLYALTGLEELHLYGTPYDKKQVSILWGKLRNCEIRRFS